MPALVAMQHDPHLRGFYAALLGRHKRKLQALIAVARKILHAIFGMFRTGSPYDGQRLFPRLVLQTLKEKGSLHPPKRKIKYLQIERESSQKTLRMGHPQWGPLEDNSDAYIQLGYE
jgi:hypothetical protein